MLFTDSGMTIDVKAKHPLNALSPIAVTEFGISIDVRAEHPANASYPIPVMVDGRIIEVIFACSNDSRAIRRVLYSVPPMVMEA